jgi:hypothetical protein
MSHFSVLVIGENVEQQLAPYHEFECTGRNDEYVVDVDKTEEARSEYESNTTTRYRDPDGNLHDPYEDRFYRDPTEEEIKEAGPLGFGSFGSRNGVSHYSKDWGDGRGYRAKIHFIPDGWEEIKVPTSTVKSFRDFCEDWYDGKPLVEGEAPDLEEAHKYGHLLVNANGEVIRLIDRTNPNKKWDWWIVGGRWTGWLKLKPGADGSVGKPGLMTAPAAVGTADIARKGDVDFEAMRAEKGAEAGSLWDKVRRITQDTWESVRERFEKIDDARSFYREQPAIKALEASKDRDFSWNIDDALAGPREAFVQAARDRATSPFAIVKDGQWYAKGRMGWWGMSNDDGTQEDWNRRVSELLDSLRDDTRLTVVDCHI